VVERYTVIGTLSDEKTVILDEPVSLPTGRVRITVETIPTLNFWAGANVAELAEAQGVGAIQDLDDLKGDFWSEDEPIDDFIKTVREWRHEEIEL
jgi:hypothetical protein